MVSPASSCYGSATGPAYGAGLQRASMLVTGADCSTSAPPREGITGESGTGVKISGRLAATYKPYFLLEAVKAPDRRIALLKV